MVKTGGIKRIGPAWAVEYRSCGSPTWRLQRWWVGGLHKPGLAGDHDDLGAVVGTDLVMARLTRVSTVIGDR
jgi:hypothetical protein